MVWQGLERSHWEKARDGHVLKPRNQGYIIFVQLSANENRELLIQKVCGGSIIKDVKRQSFFPFFHDLSLSIWHGAFICYLMSV